MWQFVANKSFSLTETSLLKRFCRFCPGSTFCPGSSSVPFLEVFRRMSAFIGLWNVNRFPVTFLGGRGAVQECLPRHLAASAPFTPRMLFPHRPLLGILWALWQRLGTAVASRSTSRSILPASPRPHRPLLGILWALWQRPGAAVPSKNTNLTLHSFWLLSAISWSIEYCVRVANWDRC